MAGTKLLPEKVTSPIQLMAAWFSMLVLLVSILLTAAIHIDRPEWAAGYLVIFSSIVILSVLGCVTLMLTIFRPHLQEGKEYAQWLKDKNIYSAGIIQTQKVSSTSHSKKSILNIANKKKFLINISNLPNAKELISSLSKAGFQPEIYNLFEATNLDVENPDDHEAIWIGYALPTKEVIESIKIAVAEWPHLKYMHLSNDGGGPPDEVHHQVYFGGATSAANRYGLLPWLTEELLNLDENLSQENFHRIIRSKYP